MEKTAWFYVTANCDAVGVWDADMNLADFMIGAPVDWGALRDKCNANIEVLPIGKWWLTDFVTFQYGKLSPKFRPHAYYISLLEKHGLGCRDTVSLQEQAQEKELEKEKEQEQEKIAYAEGVTMTAAQHQKLVDKYGSEQVSRAVDKLSTYKLAKGKQYKSDYHAMLQWVFDAIGAKARTPSKPTTPTVKGERDESVGPMLTDLKARLTGGMGK